jgi:CRP-like cAMP-binding protein
LFLVGKLVHLILLLQANGDFQQTTCQERLSAINERMESLAVEHTVQSRVVRYFDVWWAHEQGADVKQLLAALPLRLRTDIFWRLSRGYFLNTPELGVLPESCLMALAERLQPVLFVPGSLIVSAGLTSNAVVFAIRGTAEVVNVATAPSALASIMFAAAACTSGAIADPVRLTTTSSASGAAHNIFGNTSLFESTPETNDVRAATVVEALVLSRPDLDAVAMHFAQLREILGIKPATLG